MSNNMVTLSHLSIGYGSRIVLSDINATLQSGQMTSLLGPNGAGKSTLLRTLAAFQPSISGEIIISGRPLRQFSSSQLSTVVGVVLTDKVDVHGMTVSDLVAMGRSPYTGFWGGLSAKDKLAVEEAMTQVGISSLSQRYVHTLSDGERQKVMIAKALAQQTPIILLDEPTAFLDFPSKVEMMRLLRRLAHQGGKTIFLSTHDVELALQLSDSIWLMLDGLLQTGSREQLIEKGLLSRFIHCEGVRFDAISGVFVVDREA